MGLFEEQLARKPNKYPWTDQFIEAIHGGHWTHREFTFNSDYGQFKTLLSPEEQEIIIKTLSAISQIEIAVKTFWAKLGENLPHPSISDLGLVMANSEVIHNNAYEHLLSVLGLEEIFEKNLEEPVIRDRVAYLKKYLKAFSLDARQQYLYSIILFTLFVENVSLFSQFYIISHFNRYKNVLKDTANQVRYTRNEETIHALIGTKLINTIREEYPELFNQELEARITEEAIVAFNAESRVIDWILGSYKQEKLDAELLKIYIGKRINNSLKDIGFQPVVPETWPDREAELQWLEEEVKGINMTDFFHGRPVEYKKGGSFDDLF
jgi:ribonucleoside-diphosphate reductase beta chain